MIMPHARESTPSYAEASEGKLESRIRRDCAYSFSDTDTDDGHGHAIFYIKRICRALT